MMAGGRLKWRGRMAGLDWCPATTFRTAERSCPFLDWSW
jgi:hypothetical protein